MSEQVNENQVQEETQDESLHLGQSWLRPFLIAALVTALLTGPILVIEIVSPNPTWDVLPTIVFLVALEATYTTNWLHAPQRRYMDRGRYRLAEFVVIALLLRLLSWALTGGIPGLATWRTYLLSPLSFFDSTYVVYLLMALFAWERGMNFSYLMKQLTLSPAEVDYYSLPHLEQAKRFHDRPIDRERPAIFAGLMNSWLVGGLVLVLFAALTTVNLPTLDFSRGIRTIARLGLRPEMLAALLVYFLLGLWLLSQARLSMIRSRWLADGVSSRPGVIATWRRTSLILLLLVAVVAAFLPIGSTFAISAVLQAIIAILLFIVQLIYLVITLFFLTIFNLLGITQQEGEELELIPEETPMPTAVAPGTPVDETSALLAGGFFWLLVALVVVIAVVFFLRDRGYDVGQIAIVRSWWQTFRKWLSGLLGNASRQATGLRRAISTRLRTLSPVGKKPGSPWRFIRLNALPPRQQIRYFYLSTVRRAQEQGVPRSESETPVEYARQLEENWPEAGEEIAALTDAFLEARYSRREIDKEEINPVKAVWRRVRSALRRTRKAEDDERDGD